ncbi:MAG: hypothetical protein ABIU05_08990 [Nitrospirales bacterium]
MYAADKPKARVSARALTFRRVDITNVDAGVRLACLQLIRALDIAGIYMLHYDFQREELVCTDTEMLSFRNDIYRKQRYLGRVSNESLSARLEEMTINLTELHFNGEKRLNVRNGPLAFALIDVFEELSLRGIDYADPLRAALSRFAKHIAHSNYSDLAHRLKALAGKQCLFRFTDKKHIESLKRGVVRFRLASSYQEAGFSIAIRDDELNIVHQLLNSRIVLKNGIEVPVKGDLIERSAFGDYYVCCLSSAIDPKLFMMFEVDACFIIKNGDVFSREVMHCYRNQYPDDTVLFDPVEYIDPYRRLSSNNPIEFTKTVKFSYENEFRFVSFGNMSETEKVRTICIDINNIDYEIVEA